MVGRASLVTAAVAVVAETAVVAAVGGRRMMGPNASSGLRRMGCRLMKKSVAVMVERKLSWERIECCQRGQP